MAVQMPITSGKGFGVQPKLMPQVNSLPGTGEFVDPHALRLSIHQQWMVTRKLAQFVMQNTGLLASLLRCKAVRKSAIIIAKKRWAPLALSGELTRPMGIRVYSFRQGREGG